MNQLQFLLLQHLMIMEQEVMVIWLYQILTILIISEQQSLAQIFREVVQLVLVTRIFLILEMKF